MTGIKSGVDLTGLKPQIAVAFSIIRDVYAAFALERCVITSANDGQHMDGSFHYRGQAIDLRTWGLSNQGRDELASNIRQALGPQFDVVAEKDHIHVEFDPK